ncbi:hypothetical protein PHLGIDRAFT_127239 [Phlebiopsis gigantea 11061_1 CR5-6]|uniref:Large ribosomal subunit protein uL29m n=1 Tax=Phlebiopsis gigantea (strain 11061_1 CR5-6) TaxID=745531 RepID=A0A0C3PMY6_PHLG1|nr:hypothetical protein PHLGIDRAFT_127239 [Phlebiopsis gigantea 11061_1 CR5-6]
MPPSFVSNTLLRIFARPAVLRGGFLPTASKQTRAFASILPEVPSEPASRKAATPEGHMRPHLGVETDRSHGLYAFFRRVEKDGDVDYDTVEPRNPSRQRSGRSWSAAELRLKSFKDLHTLWYVLLRERNLLATQRAEARRLGIQEARLASYAQVHKVRKSMARIKYVINERRLAYEQAVGLLEARRQEASEDVCAESKPHAEASSRKTKNVHRTPAPGAEIAAAGLFGSSTAASS